MSTMKTALQQVGFKTNARQMMRHNREFLGIDQTPIRPRDVRRMQERDAVTASMEKIADDVLTLLTRRTRKVVISKAGTHLRVRYEGRQTSVLIDARQTQAEGANKLRVFDGEDPMSDLNSEAQKRSALETTPGSSLITEVQLLREQVQQLCVAVRSLVQLQSVANQKLDAAIVGRADFTVL